MHTYANISFAYTLVHHYVRKKNSLKISKKKMTARRLVLLLRRRRAQARTRAWRVVHQPNSAHRATLAAIPLQFSCEDFPFHHSTIRAQSQQMHTRPGPFRECIHPTRGLDWPQSTEVRNRAQTAYRFSRQIVCHLCVFIAEKVGIHGAVEYCAVLEPTRIVEPHYLSLHRSPSLFELLCNVDGVQFWSSIFLLDPPSRLFLGLFSFYLRLQLKLLCEPCSLPVGLRGYQTLIEDLVVHLYDLFLGGLLGNVFGFAELVGLEEFKWSNRLHQHHELFLPVQLLCP
eukprot:08319_6